MPYSSTLKRELQQSQFTSSLPDNKRFWENQAEMKHPSVRLLIAAAAAFAGFWPILSARPAAADALDEIHRRGTLIWGADQSGGGPYVYPDKDQVLRGFEVELADMLAAELHVKAQFQQGD